MKIGIPKEIHLGEKRVATTPEIAEKLRHLKFDVAIESGAGEAANFPDEAYQKAGVEIVSNLSELWEAADIIIKVRAPEHQELDRIRKGTTVISFIWPGQNHALMEKLSSRKATVLAMDCVPRISRAQKLDALSSMANIAGYRAVIEAANHFGRFFTGQITAAGKVPPAKVFVIGVGVAGLAAIGTASGLGAIVRASDTRSEVKDQVKSMGAEFVEVGYKEEGAAAGGYAKVMSAGYQAAQHALYAKQAKEVDIIITTALIPGKPAPRLITADMVRSMKPGSVIVDLAAEQGGNCELTQPNKVVVIHGVTVIGYTDLPSRLAKQASTLYSSNVLHLIEELTPAKDGKINVNMDDEVIRGVTVIQEGKITWPPPPPRLTAAPPHKAIEKAAATPEPKPAKKQFPAIKSGLLFLLAALAFCGLGLSAPMSFMSHFTVFILACFVGYRLIWNVTAALHTPLMSVTNAISSIIAIGAIVQIATPNPWLRGVALLAIALTAINMIGGFRVTQRMLNMFKRK